jgi:hypothetical protein
VELFLWNFFSLQVLRNWTHREHTKKNQKNNSKVRKMDGNMDAIGKELEANRTILDQAIQPGSRKP